MFANCRTFEQVMLGNGTLLPELAKQGGCKESLPLVGLQPNPCTGLEDWNDSVAARAFAIDGSFQKLRNTLASVSTVPRAHEARESRGAGE